MMPLMNKIIRTITVLSILSLGGCYSRQRFAKVALESSQPILKDYRRYLDADASLGDERRKLRKDTVDGFEEFLKEGAAN